HLQRPKISLRGLHVFFPVELGISKSFLGKFPYGVGFACAEHHVASRALLKHLPDGFDVFGSIPPVTFSVEVSKEKLALFVRQNRRDAAADFARDKCFSAARALVVEQDAVAREELVPLAINARHPIGIDFCRGIRAARLEWGRFALRRRRGAKHFRTRSLVKPCLASAAANGLEKPCGSRTGDVTGI